MNFSKHSLLIACISIPWGVCSECKHLDLSPGSQSLTLEKRPGVLQFNMLSGDPYAKLESFCVLGMGLEGDLGGDLFLLPATEGWSHPGSSLCSTHLPLCH
jgi:hypothetical protein